MNLKLDIASVKGYKSNSQKIRVLTETWGNNNLYCPNCGNPRISQYPNNQPVADFFCPGCDEDYELKSKKDSIGIKIVDGAYSKKIERLKDISNPNLFVLNYNKSNHRITNLFVIPKYYFVTNIIEKRKPLSSNARRAGWIGSNILLNRVPNAGKTFYIRNNTTLPKKTVMEHWNKTSFLQKEKSHLAKGWIFDVMNCIDKLGKTDFTLNEMYSFAGTLSVAHPDNKHIKDKIRQQLQYLRDRNYLEFTGRGKYRII